MRYERVADCAYTCVVHVTFFQLCIIFIFVNAAHVEMLPLCLRGEKNKNHSSLT